MGRLATGDRACSRVNAFEGPPGTPLDRSRPLLRALRCVPIIGVELLGRPLPGGCLAVTGLRV
jgi:hypothetical protein